jgi:hypothetical protein
MNITVKTISHVQQRYETAGDYFYEKDTLHVRISKMANWRYEWCVLIHELVEIAIVKHQGISFAEIDKFDKDFELCRAMHNTDEPGDDERSPYKFAHCVASGVERIVAACLGVSWKKYESTLNAL